MKNLTSFTLILFCFTTITLKSQNAPVTTAAIITNATTAPASVIVPITIKNFMNIGAFKLTLTYNASLVTYDHAVTHPSFPGMTVSNSVIGNQGNLVINWPQTPGGVTLPDETHLLDLTFSYISATSTLTWLNTDDTLCQYKKYSGGTYINLTDNPASSYYINGGISNRGAPITYAPVINNPSPGLIAVPITVDNFTAVAAISLALEYNQAVLSFQGCTPNPSLGANFSAGSQMGPNGKRLVTISWYGLANLGNGSTLFTINFIYSNTNGSCSSLDWFDNGSSCEYADNFVPANPYLDFPTTNYYHNGAIYTQLAPNTWLPVKTDAVTSGSLSLPVFVNDFTSVRSFNLSFEYDPVVMTYGSFMPDTAFGSALAVSDNLSGSKRKITMSWTGTANKTLPDGHLIANLNFTYNTGTTTLKWLVSDVTSCRFNDENGNAYFDSPKSTYYKDGLVASHVAPQSAAGNRQSAVGSQVTVPVNVYNFNNIGLFSYTIDYDPSVLTYQSASLAAPIGGAFTPSTSGLGRIIMNWSGTATSLPDSTDLINLNFIYNGGESPLAWFDDGNSSRYAESISGPSLYDLPRSFYFINGYVGPNPLIADFIVNAVTRDFDTTVTLIDLTIGGPTMWNWSISPSTYYFVNGTTESSQNPQVRFTSNGAYTVTLIVSRGTISSIRIRSDYMYIGTPGLWTGITSGDWSIGSNWHNFQVPATAQSVTIPADRLNFPHLTGDLTIGLLCQNITIVDSAQLIVDGDLTINTGSSLTFTGAGILFLGGNWSNLGTFNMGTGTIDFTGPNDAAILGGVSPESFYKIIVSKPNAILSIQGTINVLGTENP